MKVYYACRVFCNFSPKKNPWRGGFDNPYCTKGKNEAQEPKITPLVSGKPNFHTP